MRPYREFLRSPDPRPAIVAHRGAWRHAPENSLAAIEAAIQRGFDIAEIDTRRSADGVFFLLHDETVDRTADARGAAERCEIDRLTDLRLRAGMGGSSAPVTDHRIPRLIDALRLAAGRIYLDVDVKRSADLEDAAHLIAGAGLIDTATVKMPVQTAEAAQALERLYRETDVTVMPITRFDAETADALIALLAKTGAPVVETKFDRLETIEARIGAFRAAGLTIWVNTLDPVACDGFDDRMAADDPAAVWGRLIDAGVAILQTDLPDELAAFRRSLS